MIGTRVKLQNWCNSYDAQTILQSAHTWRAPMNTKRGLTRDHLQHRRKLSVPSPQRPPVIHHPPTLPPPLTMESFYRWYAEQGCPTPNPDYSHHMNHNLYRNLVRRPRSPSVLNLTQTPTTTVQKHETQHLLIPTLGQPLRRSSIQLKHAI
jgi:hypothetical protein